jgi:hypothetical protein
LSAHVFHQKRMIATFTQFHCNIQNTTTFWMKGKKKGKGKKKKECESSV